MLLWTWNLSLWINLFFSVWHSIRFVIRILYVHFKESFHAWSSQTNLQITWKPKFLEQTLPWWASPPTHPHTHIAILIRNAAYCLLGSFSEDYWLGLKMLISHKFAVSTDQNISILLRGLLGILFTHLIFTDLSVMIVFACNKIEGNLVEESFLNYLLERKKNRIMYK